MRLRKRMPGASRPGAARLSPYYRELEIDETPLPRLDLAPFGEAMCEVIEATRPDVVSFHFGLPAAALVARIKAAGCRVISSATTVEEARWLEAHGADAVIAQGAEAGGHRATFLASDLDRAMASQSGTLALVPQIAEAVQVPVIAAGGIADGRGVAAAFALGASGVQIGTAFLRCPEAGTSPLHREALLRARDNDTVLTNVFTGRPARAIANRLPRELGLYRRPRRISHCRWANCPCCGPRPSSRGAAISCRSGPARRSRLERKCLPGNWS